MFFRALTPAEEAKFRTWARDNYEPGAEINGIWHPVVQDECVRVNQEKAQFVVEPAAEGRPKGSTTSTLARNDPPPLTRRGPLEAGGSVTTAR